MYILQCYYVYVAYTFCTFTRMEVYLGGWAVSQASFLTVGSKILWVVYLLITGYDMFTFIIWWAICLSVVQHSSNYAIITAKNQNAG